MPPPKKRRVRAFGEEASSRKYAKVKESSFALFCLQEKEAGAKSPRASLSGAPQCGSPKDLRGFSASVTIGVKPQRKNAKRSQSGGKQPLIPQVIGTGQGVKANGKPKKKICTVDSRRDNGTNRGAI